MNHEPVSRLEESLSEIFDQSVSADILEERGKPEARLTVCNMSYRVRSQSTHSAGSVTTVRQTAVVFDADDLDVPQFFLSPRRKGLLGKLISGLASGGDITFEDSPVFSQAYYLHGWVEEPVRILFTKELRNHFEQNPGWSVRGKGRRLVIFYHDTTCDDAELDDFVHQAIRILSLFVKGEHELDARPEVRRKARPKDLASAADRMGGLAGAMLKQQLAKLSVTRAELEAFLNAPIPRDIPAGLKRQELGDIWVVTVVGLGFFVAGIVAGPIVVTQLQGRERWIGLPFIIVLPIVGGLIACFSHRYRRRKARTLRMGDVTEASVTQVKRTNLEVNNQVRHAATVVYTIDGTPRTTTCNLYGPAAEKARLMAESGDSMRVLVDPKDPAHVVCPDLVMIIDE